jgi:GNAT superfamily N-acetyltransferase
MDISKNDDSNSQLQIRFAQPSDLPHILNFIKALADYEKLSADVIATENNLRTSLFENKDAEVLIAFYDNEPAGFALFFHNYSTFLAQKGIYLEDLYVHSSLRGKGIGKKLLQRLTEVAIDRNCGRLEWAVLDWNTPAIDFYLAIGAKANSEWTTYRLTENDMKKFVCK